MNEVVCRAGVTGRREDSPMFVLKVLWLLILLAVLAGFLVLVFQFSTVLGIICTVVSVPIALSGLSAKSRSRYDKNK